MVHSSFGDQFGSLCFVLFDGLYFALFDALFGALFGALFDAPIDSLFDDFSKLCCFVWCCVRLAAEGEWFKKVV